MALLTANVAAQGPVANSLEWIAEQGVGATQTQQTIELNGTRGWIRLNSVFSDFVMESDFLLPTEASSASISIRSRPNYDRPEYPFPGYHLVLSNTEDFGRLRLVGVTAVQSNSKVKPVRRPVDEWQHVRIEAELGVLRITLNGGVPLVFERVDEFAGYVALRAGQGRTAFRNVRITRILPREQQFNSEVLRDPATGVKSPRLERERKPFYPKEPHDAGIQGVVKLEAVVQQDGSVGDVRVTAAKHPDLDQAAIAAVRKWRFEPARKDGQAIPLIVSIEMAFTRTK